MTDANIFVDAAIIGGVTCLMCTAGVLLGKRLGPAFEQKAEILGGVTLILLGVQILTEHLLGAA